MLGGWGAASGGMQLPEGPQGSLVHTQQCKNPGAAAWGSVVGTKELTGRFCLGFVHKVVSSGLRVKNRFIC